MDAIIQTPGQTFVRHVRFSWERLVGLRAEVMGLLRRCYQRCGCRSSARGEKRLQWAELSDERMHVANEALERARAGYEAVERRYVEALQAKGLRFQSRAEGLASQKRCADLRRHLADAGAAVRNAGASLVCGYLSPACVECTGADGSETISTTFKCHRDCYFCFNHNVADYDRFFHEGCPWEDELERAAAERQQLACVGLTGGEPLLDFENAIRFFERARELFPEAHLRMYTSGDLLTEERVVRLRDAGLDEIRFSVKDDDTPEMQQRVLDAMRLAKRYLPSVMAEMPVIPGAGEHMRNLLRAFDDVGLDGINLLEFCFPFCNWPEFERRGFSLKNPPFDVMYDYGYSGGLAVAGSEELILELMLWAREEGLRLGLHYCSLDNKHRSEIRQKNERAKDVHPCLVFDDQDFFLKAVKVFGPDVEPVRTALREAGCTDMIEDAAEGSLAFSPEHLGALRGVVRADGAPVEPQLCPFVYELDGDDAYLTDVSLCPAPVR